MYIPPNVQCTLHKVQVQGEGGATFDRVNICTNQNETLMKQIPNSQKSILAYGFLKSQEKNPRTKSLETSAKSL
jgi:hypothetical protein